MIQDLRYSVRSLARAPGFTLLVLLILALGVGANSAVFSIVDSVLLRPLPFHDPDTLYQLDEVDPKGQPSGVSPADLDALLLHTGAFSQGAVSSWHNATLTGPEGDENVYGARISAAMLPMLGVRPAFGRALRPDEFQPGAPAVVLLTDRLWKRRFGRNPTILGRQLMMNGQAYTVAGVLPADFFLSERYEFYIPWQLTAAERGNRDERWPCLVRLKTGAAQAQAAIAGVYRNTAPEEYRKNWRARLTPVHQVVTAGSRPALLVILGAVAFVLLIACFNIANLLAARGANRSREMAIRAALGAGRLRVLRQLLTESVLLSIVGGIAGALMGALAAGLLVRHYPNQFTIPRLGQTRMDLGVLLFTLAISVLTGIVFGLIPAYQAMRLNIQEALKQGARGSAPRTSWMRHGLVVAETALSLILLVGAGLMLHSFMRLVSVDAGFHADRVLTLRVPLPSAITGNAHQAQYYTRLVEQVAAIPGLNSAGLITPLPLAGVDANSYLSVEGRPDPAGEPQLVKLRSASPGYFRAMGLTLRQGRVFNESDSAQALPVAVVSETLARRYFPNENPVGRRISMSGTQKGPWLQIVGVVKDIRSVSLAEPGAPELYRDYRQFMFAPFATTLVVRTQSSDPASLSAAIERRIRAMNPEQPIVDLLPMAQVVSDSVAQPRFYTWLLGIFAGLALLAAAAGLYGVLSYSVTQRIREIGIRLALGAPRLAILGDVVGRAMALIGVGAVIGLAGAVGLTRLLQSQLYEVKPVDPLTYTGVIGLLAAVGGIASYIPARRAMRVDPNVALRSE